MASVITKRCRKCLYCVDDICNFYLRTGRRRGCPAGDKCTEYVEGPRKITTPLKTRQMQLYPEREDRTIQMWRVRMGYKANAPAHRAGKENVQ